MTSAFRICTPTRDGTNETRDVVGHRFRVTVDNTQFWFGVHEAHDTIGLYRITDIRSGRKVLDIPHPVLAANRGSLEEVHVRPQREKRARGYRGGAGAGGGDRLSYFVASREPTLGGA